MNTTGIVRKIDDLGRIVLPKELRKCLNINSGDDFQITVNDEKIILEKYSRLENFEQEAKKIIDCFSSVTNYKIYLTINNKIVNYNNVILNDNLYKLILERKIYIHDQIDNNIISSNITEEGKIVIFPIVVNSDLLGSIIIVSNDKITNMINNVKIINNLIKNYFVI